MRGRTIYFVAVSGARQVVSALARFMQLGVTLHVLRAQVCPGCSKFGLRTRKVTKDASEYRSPFPLPMAPPEGSRSRGVLFLQRRPYLAHSTFLVSAGRTSEASFCVRVTHFYV